METIAPLSDRSTRLPVPQEQPNACEAPTPATPPAAPAARTIWTLSRETATAAVSAQMLAAPRRGLRADQMERARYHRAYRGDEDAPAPAGTGDVRT